MECDGWIGIESTLRNIVVDCNGLPALSVEPSATMSFSTVNPLDCEFIDIETLFTLLLNDAGTAIKTVTGAIDCNDFTDCDFLDWKDVARRIIVEGDDGLIYLKAGACDQTCTEFFDCDNQDVGMESLFKMLIAGPDNPFLKIISCQGDCDDYFDCEHLGFEDIFRLLVCEEGLRIIECVDIVDNNPR